MGPSRRCTSNNRLDRTEIPTWELAATVPKDLGHRRSANPKRTQMAGHVDFGKQNNGKPVCGPLALRQMLG